MRKLSLRVNRLQRVQYGSYKINQVPLPNDLSEIPLDKNTGQTLKRYY